MTTRRGFTLIEVLVVVAITGIVFGLVIDALIQTDRASRDVVVHQQMRQEAMIISNTIEKALRQGLYEDSLVRGGAGQTSAAGGGTTVSEIPKSLSVTGMTSAVITSTQPTPQTTASAAQQPRSIMAPPPGGQASTGTTVPASIQSLFTTSPVEANTRGTSGVVQQQFAPDRIRISTLAFGVKNGTGYEISSEGAPGALHIVLRDSATQAARKLGAMSDRYQSQVTYRYAENFNGVDAVWSTSAARPRLVEYTVRVWPAGMKHPTFETAIADNGAKERFSITTAVALP